MGYPGRHNIYEATIRRMVTEALEKQEQEFKDEHASDSDEQLLTYLKTCAMQLRHSPWPDEITGGTLIKERFGSWERALSLAGLAQPPANGAKKSFARIQEETQRQKEVYRQRKAEKKLLAEKRRIQQSEKKKQHG